MSELNERIWSQLVDEGEYEAARTVRTEGLTWGEQLEILKSRRAHNEDIMDDARRIHHELLEYANQRAWVGSEPDDGIWNTIDWLERIISY
jgi:hypothetical protein